MNEREAAISRALDRLTSERMDEIVAQLHRPIELEVVSGDWIPAREARLFVSSTAKVSLSEAEGALCRRAAHWIPLRVATFGRLEEPHDYVNRFEFFGDKDPDLSHFKPHPMNGPWCEVRMMFEALGGFEPILAPCGVHYAHWATGDFKVTIAKDFSDVTLEIGGLEFDRPALERALGIKSNTDPLLSKKRLTDAAVARWIDSCGVENSKLAWQAIRAEFGAEAPKKTEQFERIWRQLKGNRPRGRPRLTKPL